MFLVLFFVTLWYSFSQSLRISLTGDDWIITNNQSFSVRGQIPGTIHTVLFAAKQIPEPYLGYNDVNLRSLVYSSWLFKKRFSLTDRFHTFTQFILHFDQIDTVANIKLNECFIGRTTSMFVPYTFVVMKSCLNLDENELRIAFESPILYAMNQSNRYPDTLLPICPPDIQHGECYIQFIRKEICSFSWDWGPAFAPIGIPGDVYLIAKNPEDISIQIESINVASYQIDVNQWRIDVLLTSTNQPFHTELEFILEKTSYVYHANSTFNRTLSISLFIPDQFVQLWWPSGYGEAIMYNLSVYDHRDRFVGFRSIGFRTVQLIQHDYGSTIHGRSFYFLLNYQPIFIKGSNWIPPDAFQERVSDDKLERLLRSAQLANMNMIRISGVGIYERDSFYDMADRLGMMIWHDFMFGNALYPVDERFLGDVEQETRYQVKRLQSHPSIVLWAANNENEVAIAENWYGIPKERMNKVKDEYRKLNIDVIMKAVKEVDQGDNRPFVVSSPTNGIESIEEDYVAQDPNSPLYGDVHFYGFQNDTWDFRTYPIPRFLTETGIQSLPSLDTWFELTKNRSDLNFDSDFIRHREHSDGQMVNMMNRIQMNLPLPITNDSLKKFDQFIYLSQINQAMTLKSINDHCRLHTSIDRIDPRTGLGHTMGLLYWQINDIWQGITWSTIDYRLRWKMSHYYVQNMYSSIYPIIILNPYLASTTDPTAVISISIVSDRLDVNEGILICSLHRLDTFLKQSTFTFNVVLNSSAVQPIIDLPYAATLALTTCSVHGNHCLFRCVLHYHHQTIEQTLFLVRPKHYHLNDPNLRIQHIQSISSNMLRLIISATQPALFVWLDTPRNLSGYFSKNGFHLFDPRTTVDFYSWTPMNIYRLNHLDFSIRSLFMSNMK